MPRVGQALPASPHDILEVMSNGAPLESTVAFDPKSEAGYASGQPMTGDVRRTTVLHQSARFIPVYNFRGEDRDVAIEDVEAVINPSLPTDRRLHLRCPLCISLPNGGLHPFKGVNGCPGKPQQKFMICPICVSKSGLQKRVYEEAVDAGLSDEPTDADPNFETYDLPDAATRKQILQGRLDLHMTSFHASDAQAIYGLRREVSGNGWRVVKG